MIKRFINNYLLAVDIILNRKSYLIIDKEDTSCTYIIITRKVNKYKNPKLYPIYNYIISKNTTKCDVKSMLGYINSIINIDTDSLGVKSIVDE